MVQEHIPTVREVTPMLRAFIYARYSSDDQREESIVAQVRACKVYAERNGYEVERIYSDEAISGKGSKTHKRAQYQRMMKDAEKGLCDVILIHKYDRVARNVPEHVNIATRLAAADVDLIAVDQDFGDSKEAKLMKVLMWATSEFYIDNLAEETRKGQRETALQAKHNGGYAPFGYDVEGQRYVINDLEAAYVRKAFAACLNGEKLNDLIQEMNAAGMKGKRGKPIAYTSLYEILRNEKYVGVYTYKVNVGDKKTKPEVVRIENALPAIVDRQTWEGVQKIMDSRKRNGRSAKHEYLLSGLMYCECGAPMYSNSTKRTKGDKTYEYHNYICSAKCGNGGVSAEYAEKCVFDYLRDLLTDENRELLQTTLAKYQRQTRASLDEEGDRIKKEIGERQKRIDTLMDNLGTSVLPPAILEKMGQEMTELDAQITVLQAELERPREFSKSEVMKYFDAVADLENQSFKMQKATIRWYIEKVSINANSVNVKSTFTEFVENNGCGGGI